MKKVNVFFGVYLIPSLLYFTAIFYGVFGDVIFSWTMPVFYASLVCSSTLTLLGIYFFVKNKNIILLPYIFVAFLPLGMTIMGKLLFYWFPHN